MSKFRAFRINQETIDEKKQIVAGFQEMEIDELTAGEVVVKVCWSGINYKDALAATGTGKILRQFPLNGGVDLSGIVMTSDDSRFKTGDRVLVCGCGLSETADGGYAEIARVCADCLVAIPDGISLREAMAIGTGGFTAALAVMRMEENNQTPDHGPIVVTGATGGVGSFAIDMLSNKDYEVIAFTGKSAQHEYLKQLGATDFLDRHTLEMGSRPLEKATWGGAVDNAGGEILAWLTRTVKPWGNIASIGLVSDYKLETTVMPFILRGVSLLGINSIEMPDALRQRIWSRVASDLKPQHLDTIVTREINFDDLQETFSGYLNGEQFGKTVVKIQDE